MMATYEWITWSDNDIELLRQLYEKHGTFNNDAYEEFTDKAENKERTQKACSDQISVKRLKPISETDEAISDMEEKPKTRGRGRKRKLPTIIESGGDDDGDQSVHSLGVKPLPTPTYSNSRISSKTNPLTDINDKIYGLTIADLIQIMYIFKTCPDEKNRNVQLKKNNYNFLCHGLAMIMFTQQISVIEQLLK